MKFDVTHYTSRHIVSVHYYNLLELSTKTFAMHSLLNIVELFDC